MPPLPAIGPAARGGAAAAAVVVVVAAAGTTGAEANASHESFAAAAATGAAAAAAVADPKASQSPPLEVEAPVAPAAAAAAAAPPPPRLSPERRSAAAAGAAQEEGAAATTGTASPSSASSSAVGSAAGAEVAPAVPAAAGAPLGGGGGGGERFGSEAASFGSTFTSDSRFGPPPPPAPPPPLAGGGCGGLLLLPVTPPSRASASILALVAATGSPLPVPPLLLPMAHFRLRRPSISRKQMKLHCPARPSPSPFLAAPHRSRAARAAPITVARSAAAEKKERSSSNSEMMMKTTTTGSVAAEEAQKKKFPPPPSPLLALSPEAKNTVALLRSLGTSDVVHTGGESFLSHLIGVYRVLKSWGCPEHLCLAGLAHSIYSTEGFQGFSLECSAANRARVANALGSLEAEKVAHVFCCTDRGSQDRDLFLSEEGSWAEREHRWRVRKGAPLAAAPVVAASPSSSSSSPSPPPSPSSSSSPQQLFVPGEAPADPYPHGTIALSHAEWLDYTTLTLADWMEQVESAALKESEHFGWGVGQAWGYRRRAFAAMARAVGGAGAEVYAEVMAREPEGASREYEWAGWEEEEEEKEEESS